MMMATPNVRTNHYWRFFVIGFTLAYFVVNSGMLTPQSWFRPTAPALYAQADTATPLRVMSWNVLFMNKNDQAFNEAIAIHQPDIIAFQELNTLHVNALQANWQTHYPYMQLFPTGTPAGMGIVSRYPFIVTSAPDFREGVGCNCQIVTIDIAGRTVTLINAHPWPPEIEFAKPRHWSDLMALNTVNQDPIFDQLLNHINAVDGPLLVMGDMNTMPFQPNVQRISKILTDTFAEVGSGLGYTFPADGTAYNLPSIPFMRIDYIFHNAVWSAKTVTTDAADGSDHRYVVADLLLN
jgi:endonuclease/exonuclease/phosphatase (EEP) superfamily protein YafD